MKFSALALLMVGTQAVNLEADMPIVQAEDKDHKLTPEEQRENTMWYIDGLRGYHEGFTKAFYKSTHSKKINDECLDDTTIDNVTKFQAVFTDPTSLMSFTNLQNDFNLFAEGAEIMENFSACKFEAPMLDLMLMCSGEEKPCAMSVILENMTKNMFVMIGKLTSMAETMKDFPAKDREEFQEQSREIGSDMGTFVRVLFNY